MARRRGELWRSRVSSCADGFAPGMLAPSARASFFHSAFSPGILPPFLTQAHRPSIPGESAILVLRVGGLQLRFGAEVPLIATSPSFFKPTPTGVHLSFNLHLFVGEVNFPPPKFWR